MPETLPTPNQKLYVAVSNGANQPPIYVPAKFLYVGKFVIDPNAFRSNGVESHPNHRSDPVNYKLYTSPDGNSPRVANRITVTVHLITEIVQSRPTRILTLI
jgi:hypothetical protein